MVNTCHEGKDKEWIRRRQLRLLQVRKQSDDIAKRLRERVVKEETQRRLQKENELEMRFQLWKTQRLSDLDKLYRNAITGFGMGHKMAVEEPNTKEIMVEKQRENMSKAKERGASALEQELRDKREIAEKKMIPVQRKKITRQIEDLRSSLVCSIPVNQSLITQRQRTIDNPASPKLFENDSDKFQSVHKKNLNHKICDKESISLHSPPKHQPEGSQFNHGKLKTKVKSAKRIRVVHDGSTKIEPQSDFKTLLLSGQRRNKPWVHLGALEVLTEEGQVTEKEKGPEVREAESRKQSACKKENVVKYDDTSKRNIRNAQSENVLCFGYSLGHKCRYKDDCIVQRADNLSQPDANELAWRDEVKSVLEKTEKENQKVAAEERGCRALEKEKITRNYNDLMTKLHKLSAKEKLIKSYCHSSSPHIFMSDERRKELSLKKQRIMDSKFERIYYDVMGLNPNADLQTQLNFGPCAEEISPDDEFENVTKLDFGQLASNLKTNSPVSSSSGSKEQKSQLSDLDSSPREVCDSRNPSSLRYKRTKVIKDRNKAVLSMVDKVLAKGRKLRKASQRRNTFIQNESNPVQDLDKESGDGWRKREEQNTVQESIIGENLNGSTEPELCHSDSKSSEGSRVSDILNDLAKSKSTSIKDTITDLGFGDFQRPFKGVRNDIIAWPVHQGSSKKRASNSNDSSECDSSGLSWIGSSDRNKLLAMGIDVGGGRYSEPTYTGQSDRGGRTPEEDCGDDDDFWSDPVQPCPPAQPCTPVQSCPPANQQPCKGEREGLVKDDRPQLFKDIEKEFKEWEKIWGSALDTTLPHGTSPFYKKKRSSPVCEPPAQPVNDEARYNQLKDVEKQIKYWKCVLEENLKHFPRGGNVPGSNRASTEPGDICEVEPGPDSPWKWEPGADVFGYISPKCRPEQKPKCPTNSGSGKSGSSWEWQDAVTFFGDRPAKTDFDLQISQKPPWEQSGSSPSPCGNAKAPSLPSSFNSTQVYPGSGREISSEEYSSLIASSCGRDTYSGRETSSGMEACSERETSNELDSFSGRETSSGRQTSSGMDTYSGRESSRRTSSGRETSSGLDSCYGRDTSSGRQTSSGMDTYSGRESSRHTSSGRETSSGLDSCYGRETSSGRQTSSGMDTCSGEVSSGMDTRSREFSSRTDTWSREVSSRADTYTIGENCTRGDTYTIGETSTRGNTTRSRTPECRHELLEVCDNTTCPYQELLNQVSGNTQATAAECDESGNDSSSLPDVMAELLKRKIISSPFKWDQGKTLSGIGSPDQSGPGCAKGGQKGAGKLAGKQNACANPCGGQGGEGPLNRTYPVDGNVCDSQRKRPKSGCETPLDRTYSADESTCDSQRKRPRRAVEAFDQAAKKLHTKYYVDMIDQQLGMYSPVRLGPSQDSRVKCGPDDHATPDPCTPDYRNIVKKRMEDVIESPGSVPPPNEIDVFRTPHPLNIDCENDLPELSWFDVPEEEDACKPECPEKGTQNASQPCGPTPEKSGESSFTLSMGEFDESCWTDMNPGRPCNPKAQNTPQCPSSSARSGRRGGVEGSCPMLEGSGPSFIEMEPTRQCNPKAQNNPPPCPSSSSKSGNRSRTEGSCARMGQSDDCGWTDMKSTRQCNAKAQNTPPPCPPPSAKSGNRSGNERSCARMGKSDDCGWADMKPTRQCNAKAQNSPPPCPPPSAKSGNRSGNEGSCARMGKSDDCGWADMKPTRQCNAKAQNSPPPCPPPSAKSGNRSGADGGCPRTEEPEDDEEWVEMKACTPGRWG